MKQNVETIFSVFNQNQSGWNQPFNQALFLNYDTVNPVFINNQPIPPATVVSGITYPTQMQIALNVGEVNATDFTIDFALSSTALLRIIYTKYQGAAPNQNPNAK